MASAAAPPTVLVVEDEETLLYTLAHNLKREGYSVLTASRGDDGLRLARERQPERSQSRQAGPTGVERTAPDFAPLPARRLGSAAP